MVYNTRWREVISCQETIPPQKQTLIGIICFHIENSFFFLKIFLCFAFKKKNKNSKDSFFFSLLQSRVEETC